ncbi:MAG: molybdopterin converting factor subunit 1 [Candidatus Omnitrophica bacterium]|nr:molybdopterin converting factor subunit 1 [Candidatus Omnitrophota bacterium]
MKVRALFFAQVRDAAGVGEREFEVKEGTTVGELKELVADRLEAGSVKLLPLRFAVNERFVEAGYLLREADTVAFLPPVAGG